jgi:hypothetical protein
MFRAGHEQDAVCPRRDASLGARIVHIDGADIELVRRAEVKRRL